MLEKLINSGWLLYWKTKKTKYSLQPISGRIHHLWIALKFLTSTDCSDHLPHECAYMQSTSAPSLQAWIFYYTKKEENNKKSLLPVILFRRALFAWNELPRLLFLLCDNVLSACTKAIFGTSTTGNPTSKHKKNLINTHFITT